MRYRIYFSVILVVSFIGCSKTINYKPIKWEVGQWVCYEINGEPLKMSVTGKDSDLFWLEAAESEIVLKLLIEEGKLNEPRRIIAKKLGENAIEINVAKVSLKTALPMMEMNEPIKGTREIVTLPSGKFKTVYLKKEDKESWLSNTVPILGIVKYKSSDKNIVLRSYGEKGARSEIDSVAEVVEFF